MDRTIFFLNKAVFYKKLLVNLKYNNLKKV